MNFVQQANYLEDVPKDQLISMSQDPNPQFPAFLVLNEITRRTTNEKNYQAMLNKPTSTVAQEVVSNFAQPKGLQGGAPQATPLPTNISAGLSGAPTAPMQMAASGGITGFANTGSTTLPTGYTILQLADQLGVDIANPDGSLKTQDQIKNEVTIAYQGATTPAVAPPSTVTDTSVLPAGSQPRTIDPIAIQNQLSKTVPSALGIDQDKVAGLPQVNTTTTSASPSSGIAQTTADKFSEAMESGVFATPRIDIKDLGNITPNREPLPEIPKIERDYYEVSDADRQRDLDVAALAGLAQAVGGAKNLAEFGSGVGGVALNISDIKASQREEQRKTSDAKYRDQLAMYGLEFDRTRIINEALTADNATEISAKLEIVKKNLDLDAKDADRAITAIRNDTTLAQIDATNNAQLKPFVTGFMAELNSLKEKTLPSEADLARIAELENLINQLLVNATQKAGVNMAQIISDAAPDLQFDPTTGQIKTN
tara:strand:- start:13367 stop:14815 length:1449 start_codon:yes stop_codon:yes gene_type:complete